MAVVACAGQSTIEGAGGAGGAGNNTATTSGASGGAGGTSASGGAGTGGERFPSSGTMATGCQGQSCGATCEVCEPDCVQGSCDERGSCVIWDWDGSDACPSSDQVSQDGACTLEGVFCTSDSSCSGVLLCHCGQWTLIHLC